MALKNPNLPRARHFIDACAEETLWVVFRGQWDGTGWCGLEDDNSLEGAYSSLLRHEKKRQEEDAHASDLSTR